MVDSTSVTFRIIDTKLQSLRDLADENRISLNTLVNNILDSYMEWEQHAPKVGFVPMQKSVLKDLFDATPDEVIVRIATKAADNFRDELLMIYGKVDLESMILFTKNRIRRSGFTLREFDSGEDETRRLIIRHDVGPKWSLFSKTYIERLINNVGYATKIESADTTLNIEIIKPSK